MSSILYEGERRTSPQMEKTPGIWLTEFSPGRAVVGLKDEGVANLGAVAPALLDGKVRGFDIR